MNPTFTYPCADAYSFNSPYISQEDFISHTKFQNQRNMKESRRNLTRAHITDAIAGDYSTWNCHTPVLIDAPTGSGKSTFVCQQLIRTAAEHNCCILLVSNRVALVRQQKLKVAEVVSRYYKDVTNTPDDDEIDQFDLWGNTCICTYHGLFALIEHAKVTPQYNDFMLRLAYAVFDEVHFLYSDATFAASCRELLMNIPSIFSNVIRIYMTATSWSISNSLLYSEQNAYPQISAYGYIGSMEQARNLCNPSSFSYQFLHYCMEANYDRYHLNFFSAKGLCCFVTGQMVSPEQVDSNLSGELGTLVNCIPEPSPTRKMLVFVRKKEDGAKLEKAWRARNIDAVFIDRTCKEPPEERNKKTGRKMDPRKYAEQQYRNRVWKKLLREERFDQTVLISTSVLDCGINICDPTLKTIVCFADEPTEFIQMLGRKRFLPSANEDVDVWVNIPSKKHFSQVAQMKSLELEMAEKLSYITQHRSEYYSQQTRGNFYANVFRNGKMQGYTPNSIHYAEITLSESLLSSNYYGKYEEEYISFYYQFWKKYSRMGDVRLFGVNAFGGMYVNDYVRWIVSEHKSYYSLLAEGIDYKKMVASWMNKDTELAQMRDAQRQKLIDYLEVHCESPIPESNRDSARTLITETALHCLPDNSFIKSWQKMTPKRLTQLLEQMHLAYTISSSGESRSKDWIVMRIQ